MSLASDVADFLLSEEQYIAHGLGRLNFTVDSVRIDTQGYREIGHKIRQDAIRVVPVAGAPGSSVAAVYTPARDRLSVPAGLDLGSPRASRITDQSMIVHEATHALIDFHRYTLTGAVDEACGYLAGQLYAMSLGHRQTGADAHSTAIIAAAQAVITRRRMTLQINQKLRSGDADVAALVAAIRAHTGAYPDADVQRTGDGVRRGLFDPWYMPRN